MDLDGGPAEIARPSGDQNLHVSSLGPVPSTSRLPSGQVQGRGVRRRRVILRLGGLGGQCRRCGLLFCRGGVVGSGFAEDEIGRAHV